MNFMLVFGGSAGDRLPFFICGRVGDLRCSALLLTCCREVGFYILGSLST